MVSLIIKGLSDCLSLPYERRINGRNAASTELLSNGFLDISHLRASIYMIVLSRKGITFAKTTLFIEN